MFKFMNTFFLYVILAGLMIYSSMDDIDINDTTFIIIHKIYMACVHILISIIVNIIFIAPFLGVIFYMSN